MAGGLCLSSRFKLESHLYKMIVPKCCTTFLRGECTSPLSFIAKLFLKESEGA